MCIENVFLFVFSNYTIYKLIFWGKAYKLSSWSIVSYICQESMASYLSLSGIMFFKSVTNK